MPISTWLGNLTLPIALTAGLSIAILIWKVAEKVENVLSEDTKLQIAVWLLDLKPIGVRIQKWPETFRSVFNVLFGSRFLSWKCFLRSCVYSLISSAAVVFFWLLTPPGHLSLLSKLFVTIFVVNLLPDYIALGETRLIFRLLMWRSGPTFVFAVLALDVFFSFGLPFAVAIFTLFIRAHVSGFLIGDEVQILMTRIMTIDVRGGAAIDYLWAHGMFNLLAWDKFGSKFASHAYEAAWCYPSVLTSIWLWLYLLAGWMIKVANRFDVAFTWLTSHLNIEEKPLQAIGIVVGGIIAVLCWVVYAVTQHAFPPTGAH